MRQRILSTKKTLESIVIESYMNHLEVNHQIKIEKNLNVYSLNYLVKIALSIWLKKVDKSQK
jgi:hypothetical protein